MWQLQVRFLPSCHAVHLLVTYFLFMYFANNWLIDWLIDNAPKCNQQYNNNNSHLTSQPAFAGTAS